MGVGKRLYRSVVWPNVLKMMNFLRCTFSQVVNLLMNVGTVRQEELLELCHLREGCGHTVHVLNNVTVEVRLELLQKAIVHISDVHCTQGGQQEFRDEVFLFRNIILIV